MNCTTCNMPLEPNARFCRNCGTPVSIAATNNPGANPAPPYRSTDMNESPTLLARPQIGQQPPQQMPLQPQPDRKSTRLNSSHRCISYAVFCLKKKTNKQ